MNTRVRDLRGRDWDVSRRFAPWRRLAQPLRLLRWRYRRPWVVGEEPVPMPAPESDKADAGIWVAAVIAFVLALPELVVMLLLTPLAALALVPVAAAETVAQAVVGTFLLVPRLLGLARYRVEVIGHDRHRVHCRTVLLVRGRAAADHAVLVIAGTLTAGRRAFAPGRAPDGVTVRSHRTVWP